MVVFERFGLAGLGDGGFFPLPWQALLGVGAGGRVPGSVALGWVRCAGPGGLSRPLKSGASQGVQDCLGLLALAGGCLGVALGRSSCLGFAESILWVAGLAAAVASSPFLPFEGGVGEPLVGFGWFGLAGRGSGGVFVAAWAGDPWLPLRGVGWDAVGVFVQANAHPFHTC